MLSQGWGEAVEEQVSTAESFLGELPLRRMATLCKSMCVSVQLAYWGAKPCVTNTNTTQ